MGSFVIQPKTEIVSKNLIAWPPKRPLTASPPAGPRINHPGAPGKDPAGVRVAWSDHCSSAFGRFAGNERGFGFWFNFHEFAPGRSGIKPHFQRPARPPARWARAVDPALRSRELQAILFSRVFKGNCRVCLYVLMPHHLHLFVAFGDEYESALIERRYSGEPVAAVCDRRRSSNFFRRSQSAATIVPMNPEDRAGGHRPPLQRLKRLDRLFVRHPLYFVTAGAEARKPILAHTKVHDDFRKYCQTGLERGVVHGQGKPPKFGRESRP